MAGQLIGATTFGIFPEAQVDYELIIYKKEFRMTNGQLKPLALTSSSV